MFDDAQYKLLHSQESMGSLGAYGVKILVYVKRELTDEDRETAMRLGDMMQETLIAESMRLSPGEQTARQLERQEITSLFPPPIFVEELPNGYCSRACCTQRPWFRVTTKIGPIVIGWRKRVILIDWTGTTTTATAEELFVDDVTKSGRSIHAWSYNKARAYLQVLLAWPTPTTPS